MREIIFRGKRVSDDGWVYGDLWQYKCSNKINEIVISEQSPNADCNIKVTPETIGQCTGLKDENSKMIFEGDIVEQIGWEDELYKVVFYDYGFKLYNLTKDIMFYDSRYSELCAIHGFIIKGNIHDNPELLESEGV